MIVQIGYFKTFFNFFRRISIPEAFIISDILLETLINIISGLEVYPAVISHNISSHIPFLASEKIIIEMVQSGCARDECHEKLRQISIETTKRIKVDGLPNNFNERILNDKYFSPIHSKLNELTDVKRYIGCAPFQVFYILNIIHKRLKII